MRLAFSLFFVLASLPAAAQTVVGWDFEDCAADAAMTADDGVAANLAKTLLVSGNGPTCSTGNPGNVAASFTSMANQEVSEVVVAMDATGTGGLTFAFSMRPSASANKWWRVEVSLNQGAYSALTPLAEAVDSTWTNHSYPLPAGADGVADVRVRFVATDSNGDGSGTFLQADGVGTPSNSGTFRIDDLIVTATAGVDAGPQPQDAGPEDAGPQDAGFDSGPPPPVDAGPIGAPPVITEVAWMGSPTASQDEFVEIYNPGPTIPDLSRFRLVDDNGAVQLPAVSLASGAVLVLESRAEATSLGPPDAEVLVGANNLGNTNAAEFLRLCPEGEEDNPVACDVANVPGSAWPAGSSNTDSTMVRRRADLDGSLPSSWKTFDGVPSLATDSGGAAIKGSPGTFTDEAPGFDAGPGVDGGPPPAVDAGPNETPTISLSSPSGSLTSTGEIAVVYSAGDGDGADSASVALYYDTDDTAFDGVLIARGLPLGTDRNYTWRTTTVPAGQYRVFGVVTDARGESAYAYAPGSVQVQAGGASGGGTITMVEPNGVDDAAVDGRYLLQWEIDVPEGDDGLVSLYYDTDDTGLDGEPIIFGLPVLDAEGAEGPRAYLWAPGEEVVPGAYAIYGVLEWRGGTVSDYSEFLQVGDTGCACEATGAVPAEAGLWAIAVLGLFGLRRRRSGRQPGACG